MIGAGDIGLELGSVWRRLGAKVTVVEFLDRILPGMDVEIAREAQKLFKRQGLTFKLGARVESARADGDGAVVEIAGGPPLRADRVLVAVGRAPATDGLGLAEAGVRTDAKGRIEVDDRFATSVPGIYAIGDVIRGPMLAHKAEEEGVACVEGIVTGHGHVNYDAIPGVCYTEPEIAAVGRTEEELKAAGGGVPQGGLPLPRQRPRARHGAARRPREDPGRRADRPRARRAHHRPARRRPDRRGRRGHRLRRQQRGHARVSLSAWAMSGNAIVASQ